MHLSASVSIVGLVLVSQFCQESRLAIVSSSVPAASWPKTFPIMSLLMVIPAKSHDRLTNMIANITLKNIELIPACLISNLWSGRSFNIWIMTHDLFFYRRNRECFQVMFHNCSDRRIFLDLSCVVLGKWVVYGCTKNEDSCWLYEIYVKCERAFIFWFQF